MQKTTKIKFYEFIPKGNESIGGVLYAPETVPYPIAQDGKEVMNWKNLTLELKDGIYCSYHRCTGGANMVSKELKDLLESFIGPDTDVEFLPVKTISEEYGENLYYIVHFKKVHDVIDMKNSIYAPGTDVMMKPRLRHDMVENLKIFCSSPSARNIIVSEDIYKAIKRQKLNSNFEFMTIYCSE